MPLSALVPGRLLHEVRAVLPSDAAQSLEILIQVTAVGKERAYDERILARYMRARLLVAEGTARGAGDVARSSLLARAAYKGRRRCALPVHQLRLGAALATTSGTATGY